jgi:ribosomal protein L37AE/L43A
MTGTRMAPHHCPYCGDQDLLPDPSQPDAWQCRSCLRVFAVRFLGVVS